MEREMAIDEESDCREIALAIRRLKNNKATGED